MVVTLACLKWCCTEYYFLHILLWHKFYIKSSNNIKFGVNMHARWEMKEKFRYYTGQGIYQQRLHPYNSPYFGCYWRTAVFVYSRKIANKFGKKAVTQETLIESSGELFASQKKQSGIDKCWLLAGRSIWEETVPKVLTTSRQTYSLT